MFQGGALMLLLSNPWVVGIGASIFSGLIVTLITRYIFSKRDNKEYIQKVLSSNREVLYAVRPSISEDCLPSNEIIVSLISSAARKYGVEEKNMYSVEQIADDLIKEVMDSSFINAKTKDNYCNHLTQLKKHTEEIKPISSLHDQSGSISNYRRKMLNLMSIMLGFTAMLMTFLVAFLRPQGLIPEYSELFKLTLPALLITILSAGVTFTVMLRRKVERKEQKPPATAEEKNKQKQGKSEE